jgi:hypothetical protein
MRVNMNEILSSVDSLTDIILAAGGLGIAAFGIVESLKGWFVGAYGFNKIKNGLGTPLINCLEKAYGENALNYLRSIYCKRDNELELSKIIRQGVRIGMTTVNDSKKVAEYVGIANPESIENVITSLNNDQQALSDQDRRILGRFELALDARLDALMSDANRDYIWKVRLTASFFALTISLLVASVNFNEYALQSLLLGVLAIPVAPITKDLVKAIQSVSNVIGKS